jgi:hypothetical protein
MARCGAAVTFLGLIDRVHQERIHRRTDALASCDLRWSLAYNGTIPIQNIVLSPTSIS